MNEYASQFICLSVYPHTPLYPFPEVTHFLCYVRNKGAMGALQTRNQRLRRELRLPLRSSSLFTSIPGPALPQSLVFLLEFFFLVFCGRRNVSPGGVLTGVEGQPAAVSHHCLLWGLAISKASGVTESFV